MAFTSILFQNLAPDDEPLRLGQPAFFSHLNLDQIVAQVILEKDSYHLRPLFLQPLEDLDTIAYRREVFQDLEHPDMLRFVASFGEERLVARYDYRIRALEKDDLGPSHYHLERSFLNAVEQYCRTVRRLSSALSTASICSRGLVGLRDYLEGYTSSEVFSTLEREMTGLESDLEHLCYSFLIKGDRITVGPYDGEPDYSEQVLGTFARFQQGAVANYLPDFRDWDTFAAAGVLDLVAKVYPELFARLDHFCHEHTDYLDAVVRRIDREFQFYLAYLAYIAPLRQAGLQLSYPVVSPDSKDEEALDTFDLALAAQLTSRGETTVTNDFSLGGEERILVVSGPNNGGKTTLARTFGQLHYLARLGCAVPGHDVRLFLCDRIFAHFEKAEDINTLVGKLQDELNRLRDDLKEASPRSIFILNEVFNSTTADDALFLSRRILERVSDLDALCVCVTFLDELATMNNKVVSMVSTVVPDDPATRTHKILRRPADGRAYAQAIADKYGLTFERLIAEISR